MTIQSKQLKIITVLLLLSIILCSFSVTNNDRPLIDSRTDEKIYEIISDGALPSVQIAVIDQDELVWSKSYGENTYTDFAYMNGSVQKVFDATAILQLYESGLIDLDADVNNYIPFQIKHPDYPDIPITTQMLLSHRSGLGDFDNQFSWDTECLFSPEYRSICDLEMAKMSLEDYLIASFTPDGSNYNPKVWVNEPGEKYQYSVSSYPLIRYLIEKVTGISYPDYMNDNIFEPLGMLNSGFNANDFTSQHTIPHTRIEGVNTELPVWNGNGYMMRTTAEDMAQFMLVHLNNGKYHQFQLLEPETIQLMQTKTTRGKSIFNPNPEISYPGYGLGIIHYPNGWIGHGGSTVGYQTLWQYHPGKKCGFIIMTNINGILGNNDDFQSVWKHVAAIRDILFSKLDPLAANDFFPEKFLLLCAMLTFLGFIFWRKMKEKLRKSQTPPDTTDA
jgi:CubicO group peptidase (beta-lactamase class C family)